MPSRNRRHKQKTQRLASQGIPITISTPDLSRQWRREAVPYRVHAACGVWQDLARSLTPNLALISPYLSQTLQALASTARPSFSQTVALPSPAPNVANTGAGKLLSVQSVAARPCYCSIEQWYLLNQHTHTHTHTHKHTHCTRARSHA